MNNEQTSPVPPSPVPVWMDEESIRTAQQFIKDLNKIKEEYERYYYSLPFYKRIGLALKSYYNYLVATSDEQMFYNKLDRILNHSNK